MDLEQYMIEIMAQELVLEELDDFHGNYGGDSCWFKLYKPFNEFCKLYEMRDIKEKNGTYEAYNILLE
ncbi:hypothetical protein Lser_V15G08877 [Lactuca serriola]